MFHMILTVNGECFPTHYQMTGFHKGYVDSFLSDVRPNIIYTVIRYIYINLWLSAFSHLHLHVLHFAIKRRVSDVVTHCFKQSNTLSPTKRKCLSLFPYPLPQNLPLSFALTLYRASIILSRNYSPKIKASPIRQRLSSALQQMLNLYQNATPHYVLFVQPSHH